MTYSQFLRRALFLSSALSLLIAAKASAGSATWNLNPASSDWNTAANWNPATVPNGLTDVATFATSSLPQVDLKNGGESVAQVHFLAGASAFTFTCQLGHLALFGLGMLNDSGVAQNFSTVAVKLGVGGVDFYNQASAGDLIIITNGPATSGDVFGGETTFRNESSAGNATIINQGGSLSLAWGGDTNFYDTATAANAQISNEGATAMGEIGGIIKFSNFSTAGQATIVNNGANNSRNGAEIFFSFNSSAGSAEITNNGGTIGGALGGDIFFNDDSTCGSATIINNGGTAGNAKGGHLTLDGNSSANRAVVIANGGTNGGEGGLVTVSSSATARYAQFKIYGNGSLNLGSSVRVGTKIGSLEGDGSVALGSGIVGVGLANRDTVFSGVIKNGGSLTKLGNKSLELAGSNTYTGGTTIESGILRVNNTAGSGTGTGPVVVNGGSLGGAGVITGTVTLGTGTGSGATLAPAGGTNTPRSLTIPNTLNFQVDGIYSWTINTTKVKGDKVTAAGVVISPGASFTVRPIGMATLTAGTVFTIISNTASTPISGTFANLTDGGTLTVNGTNFQANYEGGDGNDLTLTVVP